MVTLTAFFSSNDLEDGGFFEEVTAATFTDGLDVVHELVLQFHPRVFATVSTRDDAWTSPIQAWVEVNEFGWELEAVGVELNA
jgi:hypothetical protein